MTAFLIYLVGCHLSLHHTGRKGLRHLTGGQRYVAAVFWPPVVVMGLILAGIDRLTTGK